MNVTIVFCAPNDPKDMCRTTLRQHFAFVTLFDLTLTLTLLSIRFTLIWYPPHPYVSLLTKLGLSAVISPVTVADKAKSHDLEP